MRVRQFHGILLALMLLSAALVALIGYAGAPDLPRRLQPSPPKSALSDAPVAPAEIWLDSSRARDQRRNPPPPLPEHWAALPIQAAVYVPDPPALFNHLRLGVVGQVRDRLVHGDRDKLWSFFCRLLKQSPGELELLGLDPLLRQAESARSLAFLALNRATFETWLGDRLERDWDRREGSPRGTLVWWLACEFPADAPAPAPVGAFRRTNVILPPAADGAAVAHFQATIGSLSMHALTCRNLLLIGPSRRVLEEALKRYDAPATPLTEPPGALVELRRDFNLFRQSLADDPTGDIRAFADGHLLAAALETGVSENWLALAQVRKFEQLQLTAHFRPQAVEWQAALIVPQRSIYDFIALDGPRRLDRYFQADSFGLASLRLNMSGLVNYLVALAGKGHFGSKLQQSALFAGPMLALSNLPDGLGNEIAVSLAPSQDKTYLAWSAALPWRLPHTTREIVTVAGLAGAPFDSPQAYRDEAILLPQFKAKMEFRYPVLIEAPGGYSLPARPQPVAASAPAVNDNVLLIAANGWNLDDVINVKQRRVPSLADAPAFQQRMTDHAGQGAVQVYANLNHGFGYAFVTLLGELYGLPVDGVPIEDQQLPRSETFGPLGHLWLSLSREKCPPPADPQAIPNSRLRFRIVWIMDGPS